MPLSLTASTLNQLITTHHKALSRSIRTCTGGRVVYCRSKPGCSANSNEKVPDIGAVTSSAARSYSMDNTTVGASVVEALQPVASAMLCVCWLRGWFILRRRTGERERERQTGQDRERRQNMVMGSLLLSTTYRLLTDRAGTLSENSRSRSHPTLVCSWALKQQLFLGSRRPFLANQASRLLGSMHSCSPHASRPTTASVPSVPSPWLVDRWPAHSASGCLCSAA
ncbi:hypothetical protein F5Y07DRAFT_49733 [Xylaria sp. FL0933]|nr:hypothetical protein F5Y07DRAFT_49733 [Xylaria sp. FL0933]